MKSISLQVVALVLTLGGALVALGACLFLLFSDGPPETMDDGLDAFVYSATVVVEPFDANTPIGPRGQPHPPEVHREPKTATSPR
jgi:hypothetical protein